AVNGRQTPTWNEVQMALLPAALDRSDARLQVLDRHGNRRSRTLALSQLPADMDDRHLLPSIGLLPSHPLLPAVNGRVHPGSPAHGILDEGDLITAVDGIPVETFEQIGPLLQALDPDVATAMVEVERDGERLALEVAPRLAR